MSSKLIAFHTRLTQIRNERGATMVEYGLMVALIAVVVVLAVGPLGTAISGLFAKVSGSVGGGTPATP
ncbi:Flp family type IVb pilin [Knoellia sp. LjRoot47]|uniref:Flp family type IVb pilin n=1 Tax=Knoellia sp. LjRoot47 TaxID=3342330 RepID=UPI003ED00709